jgi:hypothetical protein
VAEVAPGEPADSEELEREFLESAPPMDELQWGGTSPQPLPPSSPCPCRQAVEQPARAL